MMATAPKCAYLLQHHPQSIITGHVCVHPYRCGCQTVGGGRPPSPTNRVCVCIYIYIDVWVVVCDCVPYVIFFFSHGHCANQYRLYKCVPILHSSVFLQNTTRKPSHLYGVLHPQTISWRFPLLSSIDLYMFLVAHNSIAIPKLNCARSKHQSNRINVCIFKFFKESHQSFYNCSMNEWTPLKERMFFRCCCCWFVCCVYVQQRCSSLEYNNRRFDGEESRIVCATKTR